MHFKNYLLEEQQNISEKTVNGISTDALEQILEKFTTKNQDKPEIHSLKHISEKLLIEKFSGKNANVLQWIDIFESECLRLEVNTGIHKIEILRLFLEGSCINWYNSMLIKYTINSEWSQWKKVFCDSFADKGWTPVRYAIEYKYINGCLLDYALKKERMLLDVNKSLGKQILIDLIAVGLPNYVCDKIDRKHLKDTEDLFNELRGLEHLVKKPFEKKEKVSQERKSKIVEIKKPCKICKEEKRGERYHPESNCWFRQKNSVKTVNNSELEIELNEEDTKN